MHRKTKRIIMICLFFAVFCVLAVLAMVFVKPKMEKRLNANKDVVSYESIGDATQELNNNVSDVETDIYISLDDAEEAIPVNISE